MLAEHIAGIASVQQQPVGSLWGWPGPGSGALSIAWDQRRRLAHVHPSRGLQYGAATLCCHWLTTTPCILCHLLQRLVRNSVEDSLYIGSVLQSSHIEWNLENVFCADFTHVHFPPPGLRCRTLVSPTRLHWRTSHWSLISSIPAKQRLHCLSQLSDHQTRKMFSFPLLISAASFLWPTFHWDELNWLCRQCLKCLGHTPV